MVLAVAREAVRRKIRAFQNFARDMQGGSDLGVALSRCGCA
jgi:hypothetical protein